MIKIDNDRNGEENLIHQADNLVAFPLLCGSESRAPPAHQRERIEGAKMHFLRAVAGHRPRQKNFR
jgi:hypothetical protein